MSFRREHVVAPLHTAASSQAALATRAGIGGGRRHAAVDPSGDRVRFPFARQSPSRRLHRFTAIGVVARSRESGVLKRRWGCRKGGHAMVSQELAAYVMTRSNNL
jgi:hypothetical protein